MRAVQLTGLYVGLYAVHRTWFKTGQRDGSPKSVSLGKITRIEHTGQDVRVYRRNFPKKNYWEPDFKVNVLKFDDVVEVMLDGEQ